MSHVQFYFAMVLATVMLWLLNDSDACFITNCPPGKRSLMPRQNLYNREIVKECSRCGQDENGRCFGSNICCHPVYGCNIGGLAAKACVIENQSTQLCRNTGKICGDKGEGICALENICCTPEGCQTNNSCSAQKIQNAERSFLMMNPNLK